MGILHMPQRIKQDVAPASDPLLIARAMLRDAIAAHREAERVHTALEAADLTTLDRVMGSARRSRGGRGGGRRRAGGRGGARDQLLIGDGRRCSAICARGACGVAVRRG